MKIHNDCVKECCSFADPKIKKYLTLEKAVALWHQCQGGKKSVTFAEFLEKRNIGIL